MSENRKGGFFWLTLYTNDDTVTDSCWSCIATSSMEPQSDAPLFVASEICTGLIIFCDSDGQVL